MPVMDGFEAASIITNWVSTGETKATPIVALTANAVAGAKEECLRAGMIDYITKPFEMHHLVQIVKQYVDKPTPTTIVPETSANLEEAQ